MESLIGINIFLFVKKGFIMFKIGFLKILRKLVFGEIREKEKYSK